jgi:hypothetical protein
LPSITESSISPKKSQFSKGKPKVNKQSQNQTLPRFDTTFSPSGRTESISKGKLHAESKDEKVHKMYDAYGGTVPSPDNNKETNIGLTLDDKVSHFDWCWKKTVDNFSKENIFFVKTEESYDYFKNFFMDVFYNQEQEVVKNSLNDFFYSIFSRKNQHSKSDIEMFTELYKLLEKSLDI